jgi:cytochrome b pre-mRNA-processing protein 3
MFDRLLRRGRPEGDIAARLYGAIVAQARHPVFYERFGVADTVTGRFEMVVVHLALVVDRLQGSAGDPALAQAVFDVFCVDMDRSLRELGIGDLGVPRRMKEMGEAFYGRARVYRESLAAGDRAALADALHRNVLGNGAGDAAALADYVAASAVTLAGIATADVAAAPRFADPVGFVPGAVGIRSTS